MKKVWLGVFSVVLMLMLMACGQSSTSSSGQTETTGSTEPVVQEQQESEKTEEELEAEKLEAITAGMDAATKNAYRSAQSYLNFKGFSKQGLIDQLSSEYGDGYTVEQATAAVQAMEDAGEVDWNEQAVRSGQSYLDMKGFSRDGLIQQLSSEYGDQYTVEQATYAADQLGL